MEFVLFSIILFSSLVGLYIYLSNYFDNITSFSNNIVLDEKSKEIDVSFLKYKLFNYSKFTIFFYDNGYIYCKNNSYNIFISIGKTLCNLNTYIICNNNTNKYSFYEGVSSW